MFRIEIEGLVSLAFRFENALSNVPRIAQGVLEETAQNTVERAKALAFERLKNPGTYLDSFYVSSAPMEVMFGNTHRAARFIEFGTGVHIVEPVTRKALRFEKDGKIVFARRVLHPGTQALWIISDAFKEELTTLMEKMKEATRF